MWIVLHFWKVFFQVGVWRKSKVGVKSNHSSTGKRYGSELILAVELEEMRGGESHRRRNPWDLLKDWSLGQDTGEGGHLHEARFLAWTPGWVRKTFSWAGDPASEVGLGAGKGTMMPKLDISSLRCLWDNRMEKTHFRCYKLLEEQRNITTTNICKVVQFFQVSVHHMHLIWHNLHPEQQGNGEGNGNPLQYSCLENPMDRGAWWATVHGVAMSLTWLSDLTN